MSAEFWAAQVTLLHSRPRSSDAFTSPISAQGRDLASVLSCDWLRAAIPSSHWSMGSPPTTGAGDRNSSGCAARSSPPTLCPLPAAHNTLPSSPFPQPGLLPSQYGARLGEWPQSGRQRRLSEIFEAGAKQMNREREREGHCRNAPQHLIPSSDVSGVEIKSCGWLFYIWYFRAFGVYFSFREILLTCIFWSKITSPDYLSQYSVSVSF